MRKETLTLSHITHDLKRVADAQQGRADERWLTPIMPFGLMAILLGIILKNAWVALPVALPAVYFAVRYVQSYRDYKAKKKAIEEIIDLGNISISVETLSHIAEEVIYEPHPGIRHAHSTRTVTFFHFASGVSWRLLSVAKLYDWSKEYYVSPEGLVNISIVGDEFYYVTLQGHYEISCVYPCKNFVLDHRLKEKGTPAPEEGE